jgi:hypothetical protein
LERIEKAAREAGDGKVVITIQPRPEDSRSFDLKCEYEKRYRLSRTGAAAVPSTGKARNCADKIT